MVLSVEVSVVATAYELAQDTLEEAMFEREECAIADAIDAYNTALLALKAEQGWLRRAGECANA